MDLVAGKGWVEEEEEELMSTMDLVVDVGGAVLLLARCCKMINYDNRFGKIPSSIISSSNDTCDLSCSFKEKVYFLPFSGSLSYV